MTPQSEPDKTVTDHDDDVPDGVTPEKPVPRKTVLSVKQIADFWNSRQPEPLPALLAMLGVLVLLGLGTWQVMRLHEKNTLLQQVRQTLDAAPRPLLSVTPQQAATFHMTPVSLAGSWVPLRSFRLAPRTFAGQTGYQLLIPFRLQSGQVVLVNRGFVPDGVSLVPPEENGETTLHGVAFVPPRDKPRFVPENVPSRGEWVWLDLVAMAHETGMGNVAPLVVYENRVADSNAYPIGGQVPLPFHNRHRQYAVTWYCLALALMGVWMLATGQKPKKTDEERDHAEPEAMDPVARRGLYPEATD